MGWDVLESAGSADLDAMVLLLGADGKVRSSQDFIFYGSAKVDGKIQTADGSVEHTGDNLTGEGDGDDEQIKVNLEAVAADVERIAFIVDIYNAQSKGQNFGQVKNAFVRLFNGDDQNEIVRYDLSEDYSGKVSVVVAELYRNNGEWKFKALGEGSNEPAATYAREHGVSIS
ncbi:tellurium resistance protein tere [Gordonia terrae C-6]|uniref:Tellurium resistance protein tere n=1 Tax=Gordonia terrae C-6 TaxID=1316928 RepID=R7YCT5_9ACTN|nr:tellurium resistance protein tere [Gordonia terrae C-6]